MFMQNARILVVDDDPKLSSLVRVYLERMGGLEVCEENRSSAALTTAREFRPHLAILDVNMPGKDGGDVAAELRTDSELGKIPVIFLSSLVTSCENGSRGGVHFLSKPVDPQELLDTVCGLLPAEFAGTGLPNLAVPR
jgi:DNA-binding response OmpR family regulator